MKTSGTYRFFLVANAVAFGLAILPLPYDYYTLLRLFTVFVFGYGSYVAFKNGKNSHMWCLLFVAVLYNPLLKIHLQRETWQIINLASLILSVVLLRDCCKWTADSGRAIPKS
jgi:hypothetical protein